VLPLRPRDRPRHLVRKNPGGWPFLTKDPKLLLNDNNAGKAEGIHLMIGRRPFAAFSNSTGDRQMLEYTTAGDGARLGMLVLHDDTKRDYAYGPAQRLPDSKVGTFTQALYDEAKKRGWVVISMKEDWKHLFALKRAGIPPERYKSRTMAFGDFAAQSNVRSMDVDFDVVELKAGDFRNAQDAAAGKPKGNSVSSVAGRSWGARR